MAALDWTTPRNALAALTLTGADDRNRDSMVSRLNQHGTASDAAYAFFGASAVDASKAAGDAAFAAAVTAWETSTQAAHETADRFGRYIVGGSPIPFLPDGSNETPLNARLTEAATALKSQGHPKAELIEELSTHQQMVANAYAGHPKTPHYSGAYVERTAILGGVVGTTKSYNLFEYETQVLGPLIDEANLLLAELTFT